MSYDVMVWMRRGPAEVAPVLTEDGFTLTEEGHWELSSGRWMISADIDPVEDEDIPDDVFAALRGIAHRIALHLQPVGAPAAACTRLRRVARLLAEAGEGLWQDLQTGKLTRAGSAGPVRPQARPDRSVTVLSLDWCMDHPGLMTREGLGRFLDLLERFLPEALPRRYGPWEPPGFRFAETGRDHFIDTYLSDPGLSIYATRPAFHLELPSHPPGFRQIAGQPPYWAAALTIELDAKVLEDRHWARHLPKAFAAISRQVRPFYGEARCLRGYEAGPGGPLRLLTREFEPSPVSPWWKGIPPKPALARVVGAPYLDLWPDRRGWTEEEGLAFLDAPDWSEGPRDIEVPGRIARQVEKTEFGPGELLQPRTTLPEVFPFRQRRTG